MPRIVKFAGKLLKKMVRFFGIVCDRAVRVCGWDEHSKPIRKERKGAKKKLIALGEIFVNDLFVAAGDFESFAAEGGEV